VPSVTILVNDLSSTSSIELRARARSNIHERASNLLPLIPSSQQALTSREQLDHIATAKFACEMHRRESTVRLGFDVGVMVEQQIDHLDVASCTSNHDRSRKE